MPTQKAELKDIYTLSDEDVERTLAVCGLPSERPVFSEDEVKSFDTVRGYFRDGLATNYEQAAELFQTSQNQAKKTKSANSPKKQLKSKGVSVDVESNGTHQNPAPSEETLDFTDLLASAKEQLGIRIKLTEGVQVLSACGLPDKELYTQSECDRFIGACSMIGKNGSQNIGTHIQDATAESETGLIGLVDDVTYERAQHIPGLVNQLYLKNVALSLAEQKGQAEKSLMHLKDSILAGIEGKSPLSSIMAVEWIPKSLPESPPSQNQSLLTSSDGLTIDMNKESEQNYKP